MANYNYFVGVDVSKATLDISTFKEGNYLTHRTIKNDISSINDYFSTLEKTYSDFTPGQVLVCLENTGRHMNFLLSALDSLSYCIWIENAYSIKHSLGLKRGKDDKADSKNIREYAFRFSDKAILYKADSFSISKLKALQAVRRQLVESKKRLVTELGESKKYDDKLIYQIKKKSSARTIRALNKNTLFYSSHRKGNFYCVYNSY